MLCKRIWNPIVRTKEIALCEWESYGLPRMALRIPLGRARPDRRHEPLARAQRRTWQLIIVAPSRNGQLLLQVKASLKATWDQLALFAIGDGWGPFREDSEQFRALQHFMSHDVDAIRASHQYKGTMELVPSFIPVHRAVFAISLACADTVVHCGCSEKRPNYWHHYCFPRWVPGECWGSGTFSGEVDRFGCKMAWLLPFLIVLLVIVGMQKRST